MTWYDTLGTVRYGTIRYGTIQYGTIRYDTTWYGHGTVMVRYGTLCHPGTEKAECRVGISNDLLITGIPHHRSHRALELAKGLSDRLEAGL